MNAPEAAHLAWFRKAEHNLLSISNNVAAANVPWDNVTYDAQQAAEKYLKGFLVFHGRKFPKVHDLAVLTADCGVLTRLGATSRYPDAPGEPSEADARQAVEIAERVRDAVLQRVPK